MKTDRQIEYWAHMLDAPVQQDAFRLDAQLDESIKTSYYNVYMLEHPEDKWPEIGNSLMEEFASCLQENHIDINDCVVDGFVDYNIVDEMQKEIAKKYGWHKIKADVYASIITRFTALLKRSGNQPFNEADDYFLDPDDVSHFVSKRAVEECIDIICHNTNVLEANNRIVTWPSMRKTVAKMFTKHGIPALPRSPLGSREIVTDHAVAIDLYKAWGSYSRGAAGEQYVCDSDNGPAALKKILENCDYQADPVELVVTLNKLLDVVHFRSDLANAFIEGGQQTCALISNLPPGFVH